MGIEQICRKCVDCKFLEFADGETHYNCNKLDERITAGMSTCQDYEKQDTSSFKSPTKLSGKMEQFCQEYLIDLNGRAAAIRAGYSKKSAHVIAAENLTKPNIQQRLAELTQERNKKVSVSQEKILKDLQHIVDRSLQSVPVMVWDAKSMKYIPKLDEHGRSVYEYDPQAASKALDMLSKHVGLYEQDNNQKQTQIIVKAPKKDD